MNIKAHWEQVYRTKQPNEVSWYRHHLDVSLQLVEKAVGNLDASIIDVGGGESTLIDDLLAHGYRTLSVLDLSSGALSVAKERLQGQAAKVSWLCGDIRTFALPRHAYDVWHDRAVIHFLTRRNDRAAYVRQVANAVRPGGHVIVATFGPNGPTKCSGLDVVRYDPSALHDEFGARFELIDHVTELHQTPAGVGQEFTYCYCKLFS